MKSLISKYQRLLEQQGCSKDVVEHSIAVCRRALEISDKLSISLDRELILAGAMLHDMGRCKTHGIEHALEGARMAEEEGFSEAVIKVIERHLGAGVTRAEARELGLQPVKDLLPLTSEEVIVSYADNLTSGTKALSFEEALGRFRKKLGSGHAIVDRFREQHRKIQGWSKKW